MACITYQIDGISIHKRLADSMYNLTGFCQQFRRNVKTWRISQKTQAYIQEVAARQNLPLDKVCQWQQKSGTWGNIHILLHVAQWLSPKFLYKMLDWARRTQDIETLYNDIMTLEPLEMVSPERDVTLQLQESEGGEIEVETSVGRIDLLTRTHIVEVKRAKHWKQAMGQVLCYKQALRDARVPRIHLFDWQESMPSASQRILVANICASFAVVVTWQEQ
jgi:hypothetical protein